MLPLAVCRILQSAVPPPLLLLQSPGPATAQGLGVTAVTAAHTYSPTWVSHPHHPQRQGHPTRWGLFGFTWPTHDDALPPHAAASPLHAVPGRKQQPHCNYNLLSLSCAPPPQTGAAAAATTAGCAAFSRSPPPWARRMWAWQGSR